MAKIYRIDLTAAERNSLLGLVQKGRAPGRQGRRAQILLAAADGYSEAAIARLLHRSVSTVERTRTHFVDAGLEATLHERPRPGARRRVEDQQAACLLALACRAPPDGRRCWPRQLLADKVVALQVVETISDETIRQVLNKPRSRRG
jgi:transposase